MALKSERRKRLLPSIFVTHKENSSYTVLLDSLPNTLAEMVLITFVTSVIYPLVAATMTNAFQLSAGEEECYKEKTAFQETNEWVKC